MKEQKMIRCLEINHNEDPLRNLDTNKRKFEF
jgi:hypothetical protein